MNLIPLQSGDVLASHADVTDLIEHFDYKPKTFLEEEIKRFIAWYIKFYNKLYSL